MSRKIHFYSYVILITFFLAIVNVKSQNINNYIFSTTANGSMLRSFGSIIDDVDMTTGASLLLGGSQVTTNGSTVNIGFDFWANGQRFTNFNVTPNGWVGIGTFAGSTQTWLTSIGSGIRLAPFLGALITTSPALGTIGTSAIGRIHYKTIGTAPSRICVIEFLRMAINTSVIDDTTTFQVRIYEQTGAIEYVYGRVKVTAGAPINYNIGFQLPTNLFQSVNVSTNTSSSTISTTNSVSTNSTFITNLHGFTPGNQRVYRWQPNPPSTPTNLTFSNTTSSSMTLNWNDVSDDFGYAIYRSLDGGATFSWVANTNTNVTTLNVTGLPANTLVYYRVYARRESLGDALDGSASTLPGNVVASIKDGNWNDPTTWSTNAVPSAFDSVYLTPGDTVTLNVTNGAAAHLEVDGTLLFGSLNATLTLQGNLKINNSGIVSAGTGTSTGHNLILGGTSTTVVSSGIINNGIFDMFTTASVSTQFLGTLDATLTGNGFFEFANITITKGNNFTSPLLNGTLEVLSVINMANPTASSRLTINNGTLKISSASAITPYFGNTFITVTNTAGRLWLNNPSAVISTTPTTSTAAQTLQINGHLLVDAGTINLGGGNHNGFTSTQTKITINGGAVNIFGSLSINNISTCSLTIAGGTLMIDPQEGTIRTTSVPLTVQGSGYFNMTGGTILIRDPVFNTNTNAIDIQSSSNKTMTGGTIVIGDGISNAPSSTPLATAGFGIRSLMPIFNLTINNRTDLSNTRQVRLTNDLTIINNLTVQNNAYVYLGSNSVGLKLIANNAITNNGNIAGTWITGTLVQGEISFENTASFLTFGGTGALTNLNVLTLLNPGGNLTLSNTNAWSAGRVNLMSGSFNFGSNFTIGLSSTIPVVQIGGLSEGTLPGTFVSLPAYNTTAGNPVFIYGPISGTPVTGAYNEMASGVLNASKLNVNDVDGLTANRSLNIRDSLLLSAGNLNMGTNNITVGQSASIPGRILAGNFLVNMGSGQFTRWYADSQVVANTVNEGFPIGANNKNRSILINNQGTGFTTGGAFTVSHTDASIFLDLNTPFVDDGVNINRRTIAGWTLGFTGITHPTGLIISAVGQGIGNVTNVTNLRMVRAADANAGVSVNGSGTNSLPVISRSFSTSNLTQINNTFYVGVNSSENPLSPSFIAVASGSWNNPFTWSASQVPTISNVVTIPAGITVTNSASTPIFCDSLTLNGTLTHSGDTFVINKGITLSGSLSLLGGRTIINGSAANGFRSESGSTLNLDGGDLRIGEAGLNNRMLNASGAINLISGVLSVNGNLMLNTSGAFTQTGGSLVIDGNSGIAATSVAQGTHLLNFNSSNIACSAGNIIIIDPPHSSYSSSSTQSVRVNGSASLSAFSGSHTLIFGDGVSTTPGNTNGFNVDNRRSGVMPFQNVLINAGNATGRWVSPSYSTGSFGMYIKGNLTVEPNAELRHTTPSQLVLGGNVTNNGTITANQLITFGGIGYVVNTLQTVSGSGLFRNNATSPTANFTSVVIDNSGGLTIANTASTISISNALTLTNGSLNVGNNIIKLNQGASLNRTNGYIIGSVNRFVNSGINVSVLFPIGILNEYTPVTITIPSVSTAGELLLSSVGSDHPQINSSCFNATKTVNRYWSLSGIGLSSLTNYTANISFATSDVDGGSNTANFRGQYFSSSAWNNTTLQSVGSNNIVLSGINGAAEFQVGEYASINASVLVTASATNICIGSSVTFTATPLNGGSSPAYQWRKNGLNVGTNSATYVDNTIINGDQIFCIMTSSLPCGVSPVNSNTITMQVSSPTVKGAVSPGQIICSGSSPSVLNLTGNNGNVLRWEFALSPFTTWNTITNTSTTFSPGALTQTTSYRAVVQNGSCSSLESDAAVITVNQPSVGGVVSGSSIVCSGSGSPALTLSGQSNGNVIRWESSVAPFFVWTPISNTSTTLNPGTITETTRYRAVISNGACPEVNSSEAVVTVQQPGTWLGLVSSDWNNSTNWCGGIPTITTNVTVNTGTPFQPVINANVSCRDLVMLNNTTLSFAGSNNTINIAGDLFIASNATFNPANGTVSFNGAIFQSIPALNYTNLTLNGSGFKELLGNISVSGVLNFTNGHVILNNSNITLGNFGSIVGGNQLSFAVTNGSGKLIQNNLGTGGRTGAILFPVGASNSNYNPVSLTNSGTADNFGVGILDGVYSSYIGEQPNSLSLFTNVVDKTFIITEATIGGSNLSVTAQWDSLHEASGFLRGNCYMARYNGSSWSPFTATSASGSNPYNLTVSGVTNVGLFGIGSSGALPVSWLSFKGIFKTGNVYLNWLTASEQNAHYFEVQKSVDGISFEPIGIVKANGNSNNISAYSFTDENASVTMPVLYYRLKQFDFNGEYLFSQTILVNTNNSEDLNIEVYPNPFTDKLIIAVGNAVSSSKVKVSITDITGKEIISRNGKVVSGSLYIDNLDMLSTGVYYIKINDNFNEISRKILKQ